MVEVFRVIPRAGNQRWIALAAALFVIWSIRCGYAHYAKMKHAAAVAVVSQIIALLAVVLACRWIHGEYYAGGLLVDVCRLLRIPL